MTPPTIALSCDSAYLAALDRPQLHHELTLAASQLASAHMVEARSGWPAICHECGAKHADGLVAIPHRDTCRTGRVARVLWAMAQLDVHPTRKENEAQPRQAQSEAAARETRPFLISGADATPAGRYGEPWAMDNSGMVHDAAGNTMLDPTGCELVEPDDARAMHRAMVCVNFCSGMATEDLERVGGVQ